MADEHSDLIELTADIVSSHVTNNSVAVSDLPKLIQQVHQALSGLGQTQEEPEQQKATPAVSARASIKPDFLVCMVCGQKQKTLRRHIQNAHGMTPEQYRQEFGLKADYPMVAPSYSERRRDLAKAIGLGRKRASAGAEEASPQAGPAAKKGRGRKGKEAPAEA